MSYWKPPKMWEDGECFILGGGSSLPRQFGVPEELIKKVESKEEPITRYSEYMKPIHDKHVIGTNISFLLGNWISCLYFADRTFFRIHRKEINKFHNLKVTCSNSLDKNLLPASRNIKRMKRDNSIGLGNKPDTINWNYNSGTAAIDFAAHVGVKRIMLLGFDMKPHNGRTHWHSGFQSYEKPTMDRVFERFLKYFPRLSRMQKGGELRY